MNSKAYKGPSCEQMRLFSLSLFFMIKNIQPKKLPTASAIRTKHDPKTTMAIQFAAHTLYLHIIPEINRLGPSKIDNAVIVIRVI